MGPEVARMATVAAMGVVATEVEEAMGAAAAAKADSLPTSRRKAHT